MKLYKYNGRCNVSGEKVKEYRIKAKMSQEGLVAKMQLRGFNLNQKAISRIETGDRVVAGFELMAFSVVLDVCVEALLFDEQQEKHLAYST